MEENNTNRQQRQLFFNRVLDALWRDDAADDATFAACGVVDASELGDLASIHVEGAGDLLLPLSKADTFRLRGVCEHAPFGQGLATFVDTTVRDCWQVGASKVTFPKAPEFLPKSIQLIAEKAVSSLGLNGASMQQLEAHLHKLLLYEEGGHSKVRIDSTEKLEKGMFATLVLQLPTEKGYTGGVLMVKHRNVMRTSDLSRVSSTGFGYTVFYGDCQHELERITSGTRLCLVFNLVRQNLMTSNVEGLGPEALREIASKVDQVQKVLEPWKEEVIQGVSEVYPDKLAIPLEHKYTKENLCFTELKGEDYIITEVFRNCKDSNGEQLLDLHLCMVTKHQEGDPEPDYGNCDHYSPDARGHGPSELGEDSSDSEDEPSDSEDDHDASHHTMDIVHSEEIETMNWIGMGNEAAPAFENLHIDMDEEVIVYEGEQPFYDEPDEKEYEEGHTGNAGSKLEYWYHRAMVVVWPKPLSVSVACKAGIPNALDLLESMLESNDMRFEDSLQEVIHYCENNHSEVWTYSGGDSITARLLNLCLETDELGDVACALKLLSKASVHHSNCNDDNIVKEVLWKVGIRNLDVAKAIATVVCARGWESCSSIVIELVNECALSQGESFAQLAMEILGIGNMEAAVDVARRTFEIFWTTNSQVSQLGASRICTVMRMLCFSPELQNEFGRRIVGRLKEIKTEVLTTLIIQMCPRYPSFSCRVHPADAETSTTSTTKDDIPATQDWFSQICEELTTRNFYQCCPLEATTLTSGARQVVQEKSVESQIVNLVCAFLGIGNKLLFGSLIQALVDQSKLYKKNHLVKTLLDSEAIWEELSGEALGILGLQSLVNARIEEVSQHEEPVFSWCQPLAQFPSHPTVQSFLRGPQQSLIYNGLGSLPNAREFARKYLHGVYKDGFSAIGKEGGRGAKAFCEIQKTRDAFEVATREWKQEQEEVETLMHRLERLRSDVTETNSTTMCDPIRTSGHHDKKRKSMELGGQ